MLVNPFLSRPIVIGRDHQCAVGAGFPNRWVEFKYDYLGRRIQKRSVNVTAGTDTYRRYLYDGWNLVAEFEARRAAAQAGR